MSKTIYHPTYKHIWFYNGEPPNELDYIIFKEYLRTKKVRMDKRRGCYELPKRS
jgi:hypothetical protein